MGDRRRNAAEWALRTVVVIALGALFYGAYLYAAGPTTRIQGIVVSADRTSSETGGMPLLVVRLGDGTTVRATVGAASVPVLPGRTVLLSATETQLGINKYQFISYLGEPSTEGRSNMPLQPTRAAERFGQREPARRGPRG